VRGERDGRGIITTCSASCTATPFWRRPSAIAADRASSRGANEHSAACCRICSAKCSAWIDPSPRSGSRKARGPAGAALLSACSTSDSKSVKASASPRNVSTAGCSAAITSAGSSSRRAASCRPSSTPCLRAPSTQTGKYCEGERACKALRKAGMQTKKAGMQRRQACKACMQRRHACERYAACTSPSTSSSEKIWRSRCRLALRTSLSLLPSVKRPSVGIRLASSCCRAASCSRAG